ncbi:MAG: pirin family protein [Candidatus Kapaibacterium sp.]
MITTIHKADTRGFADLGWLKSKLTFSFATYYDERRMNFGMLRVLNDDIVESGMGFGTHPHNNMEIVSIPLSGALEHKDSMGHVEVIKECEVQIMSAGTGVMHSEYNHSKTEDVNFLQIWILPKERNIKPRYDQRNIKDVDKKNKFLTVVSSDKNDNNALWINQDAYLSLAKIDADTEISYDIKMKGNGVYLFVIEGGVTIDGNELKKRDGIGIEDTDRIKIKSNSDNYLLAIEVPMG